MSLWNFPERFNYTDDPVKPLLEDTPGGYKVNTIIQSCKQIEDLLKPIAEPQSTFRKIYNFIFDRTLGYSDYV